MVRLISLFALATVASAAPMKYAASTAISDGDVAFSASDGVLESSVETATVESKAEESTANKYNKWAYTSAAEDNKYVYTSAEEKKYEYTSAVEESKAVETSAEWAYETTAAAYETTAAAYETTSTTVAYEASATSEAQKEVYTSVSYGSGYNNWGNSYNDCVQQCIAKFGNPSATATVAETTAVATETAGSGTGATHTIIVAPTQGVLRYVPWAVNASVGDTVKFMWGAGPHSVTQSSALQVCNKTLAADAFDTLPQNASFVHEQVVTTTEPTFFYCTVGVHCSKGMFGVINPAMATPGSESSLNSQMASMAADNSDLKSMWDYSQAKTKGTDGWEWGANMDMSSLPQDAYSAVFENTMYARLFYGANPGLVGTGEGASGTDLTIPTDITAALTSSTGGGYGTPSSSGDVPPANNAESASSTESSTPVPNAASRSVISSTVIVGAVAVVISLLAL